MPNDTLLSKHYNFYAFLGKMNTNPWKVDSIQDFSCLKCPECSFYTKEEIYFQNHAMADHPLSAILFGQYQKQTDFHFQEDKPKIFKSEMLKNESDNLHKFEIKYFEEHLNESQQFYDDMIIDIGSKSNLDQNNQCAASRNLKRKLAFNSESMTTLSKKTFSSVSNKIV